jgi:uncharacterized protein with ParB-like and HNH nuclease domain
MEKLSEIIEGIEKNKYLLPNFQREFVWDFKQQKDLIASVISSVPASSSLLVEENNFEEPTFKCIKVGRRYSILDSNHDRPFHYILDGQQRFTTLYFAFSNVFNFTKKGNEDIFNDLDYKVKVRWFLKFKSESGYLFNYDTLIFNKYEVEQYLPNDLIDFISEEKIKIDEIRKDSKKYVQFLRSESLKGVKIPLQLFLMDDEESYRIKNWLENLQKKRIDDLRSNTENKTSLITFFKSLEINNPGEVADNLYNDVEDAVKIFEKCIKDDRVRNWYDKVYNYLKLKITNYEIKPIVLDDMFKAISTFEYINTRGTDLSTFDLLCAKAGTSFDLRKGVVDTCIEPFDFYDFNFNEKLGFTLKDNFKLIDSNNSIQKQYAEYLAQVFNMIHFKENGGLPTDNNFSTNLQKARYSLDNLESQFLKKNYEKAVRIINYSSAILQVHCAHRDHKKIQNKLILLPIFTFLIYKEKTPEKAEIKKLIAFFWIKLFSGNYNSHQSESAKNHCCLIYEWLILEIESLTTVLKNELNNNVLKVEDFANKELLSTQKCGKSIEENIFMFLRSLNQPFRDWDNEGSNIELTDDVELHHIIPLFDEITRMNQLTKELRDDPKNILNATMNRTPITKVTNRKIGAKSPHQYINEVKPDQLANHYINDNWFLKNPDKKNLFEARYDQVYNQVLNKLNNFLGY